MKLLKDESCSGNNAGIFNCLINLDFFLFLLIFVSLQINKGFTEATTFCKAKQSKFNIQKYCNGAKAKFVISNSINLKPANLKNYIPATQCGQPNPELLPSQRHPPPSIITSLVSRHPFHHSFITLQKF